ncbi:MAG: class I adenylate-forming enzyme family protein [Candidatus Dormibacteraceae bacterium]
MVSDPLSSRARADGGVPALVDRGTGERLSWGELDRMASQWALRLARLGVTAGDRVAIVEPAGARFAAAFFACGRLGAAAVPLPVRGPERDRQRKLADCRPRALIIEGRAVPCRDPARGDPGDLCVLYTSGTTGSPKGVRQTLANHRASALGCQESIGARPQDRWLLALSPHHVGGLAILMRSVLAGRPVVTVPRFEEGAVLGALRDERPSLVSLVPVMLSRLVEAGGLQDLRRVRAVLLGGAPAPAKAIAGWRRMGIRACPTYGLTETCSQVATVAPGTALDPLHADGLAGRPHSQVSISVEAGEIVVAGPVVSPGYLDPDLRPAPGPDGFRTGDLGFLDGAGLLHVTGRADDVIITDGENVQPAEVEAVLQAHPAVRDAAVRGRPNARHGQLLEALVVAPEGVDAEALRQWCRERLPAFKVPRRVTFVSSLPRLEGGKLRRAGVEGP